MKIRKRNKWPVVLIALSWLFMCNMGVAETVLVVLHDLVDSHHHSHDYSHGANSYENHKHHTTHHPGHSREHRHGEDSESHSHGESTATSFTAPRQFITISLSELFHPSLLGSAGLSYFDFLNCWEPVRLNRAIGPPGKSSAALLLSSLSISSNAPPTRALA